MLACLFSLLMSVYNTRSFGRTPQRLRISDRASYQSISFGYSNTYPQAIEYAVQSSGVADGARDLIAKFLYGNGFISTDSEIDFGLMVVNEEGQTLNEVLWNACNDYALHNGFALLANVTLGAEYSSIECEPFKNIRLKSPADEKEDIICKALVWENWAYESPKTADSAINIQERPLFDPENILSGIEESGDIESYPGQILYAKRSKQIYPLSPFDSILEQVIADGDLSQHNRRMIRNGFKPSVVITNDNISQDALQREQNEEAIRQANADQNTGGAMYLEGSINVAFPDQKAQNEQVRIQKNLLKEDINERLHIPPVLTGRTRNAGFPNTEEMENAYRYFNYILEQDRLFITKQFEKVLSRFNRTVMPESGLQIDTLKWSLNG